MRVAQSDDIIMMRDVARQEKLHAQKMRAFFRYADHSKDPNISLACQIRSNFLALRVQGV